MIRVSQLKLHIQHNESDIRSLVIKKLRIIPDDLIDFKIIRKSVDARDKDNIRFIYSVDCIVKNEELVLKKHSKDKDITASEQNEYILPEQGSLDMASRPCITGAGPAGLFCAYMLAKNGYRPILIEQGEPVEDRTVTVNSFLSGEKDLNPYSNIQFGEGGAGTFSDGKLTSGVRDTNGRKTEVLKTFVRFGAPEDILFSAKPHVGTDVLRNVIKGIREAIIELGGTVLFNTRLTDIKAINGSLRSITVVNNEKTSELDCSDLVLAIGHSSRDTFSLLKSSGVIIEPKPFAVGIRVQHPQELINKSQYGTNYKEKYHDLLPAADYKLTTRTSDGHSVYSFCMCPGGYVINSSSEPGMLCVNGMSYSGRNGINANSAIIVSVSPKDIGADDDPFIAIEFQRELERKAYNAGKGKIPSQRLEDFIHCRISQDFGVFRPQNIGMTYMADINEILPGFICTDLKEAFAAFGKMIHGFDDPDSILCAVESRTSSPIRIPRNDDLQSISIKGLYPCGEGAGYAGGITSSAIDGIKVFEKIYSRYTHY